MRHIFEAADLSAGDYFSTIVNRLAKRVNGKLNDKPVTMFMHELEYQCGSDMDKPMNKLRPDMFIRTALRGIANRYTGLNKKTVGEMVNGVLNNDGTMDFSDVSESDGTGFGWFGVHNETGKQPWVVNIAEIEARHDNFMFVINTYSGWYVVVEGEPGLELLNNYAKTKQFDNKFMFDEVLDAENFNDNIEKLLNEFCR